MSDDIKRNEELQRKIEELKRKTLEEESRRIDADAEKRGHDMAKMRFAKDDSAFQSELKAAEDARRRQEEELLKRQQEIDRQLEEDKRKKAEVRRSEEEKHNRKEEEERQKHEIEERRRFDEETRRKAEEERQRLAEEARRKTEEDRRRKEEDRRREEEGQLRKEEEKQRKLEEERRKKEEEVRRKEEEYHRQEEDKQERIRTLVANAQVFFDHREYENASVEIAKALVNDPDHADALELEQKIHEAQGRTKEEDVVAEHKPLAKERKKSKDRQPEQPKKKSRLVVYIVLAVVILAGAFITYRQLKEKMFLETLSIAVAPWQSSSNVQDDAMIGAALAQEVTEEFQRYKQISVMGFSSSYNIADHMSKGEQAPFRLGYQYVLEGTVTRTDDQFDVELRVVDSLGKSFWNYRTQKQENNLSTLPAEIATQIVSSFKISSQNVSPSGTGKQLAAVSFEAYQKFLQGKELLLRPTDQTTRQALQFFEKATQNDDQFAAGFAAAASAQTIRFEHGWDSNEHVLEQAKQWAEQALTLNESSVDGHIALANVLINRHDYDGSLREIDLALKLSPNNGKAYFVQAMAMLASGKMSVALDALQSAYEFDPRNSILLKTFAQALQLKGSSSEAYWYHATGLFFADDSSEYLVGPIADVLLFDPELSLAQSDRVDEACQRRIQLNPNDYFSMYRLGRLLQSAGKGLKADTVLKKTEAVLRKEVQLHPKNTDAMMYLALTFTRLGKFPEALSMAQNALRLESGNERILYKMAQMYTIQMYSQKKKQIDAKKKEEALKALREALALRYRLDELTSGDFFNLRDQAEFRSIVYPER